MGSPLAGSSSLSPSRQPLADNEFSSSNEGDTDWEEVVPAALGVSSPQIGPSQFIEITLDAAEKVRKATKAGTNSAERVMRLEAHKIHTVCLIANGWIRNNYINDPLLHARLMSLTPLALQNSFTQIHKKREPDAARRGRLFEAAVMRLTQWWAETFFDAAPRGSGEIQSRTFDEVAVAFREGEEDVDAKAPEVIRSCKSLQKHALLRHGSRDVSAQLFTALCRALGVPARLVVSLQSVPWKASVGRPKPTHMSKKGKQKAEESESDDTMEEVVISNGTKGKEKAIFPGEGRTLDETVTSSSKSTEQTKPAIKLRRRRLKGRTFGFIGQIPGQPLGGYPPAQWTEVFSRPDGRWLSVDPIRNFVDKRRLFEPSPGDARNRMVYVLAFEEDGWVRDVTQRYAREFTNKISKIRVGGRGKKEWWDKIMGFLTRPYRLHRDDLEDAELQSRQAIEGMPTSIVAFKDHPIYVLERHLHRDETLQPRTEIGRFRGEPVFPRSAVVSGLKTAENWMRSGLVVASGEQPIKWVKIHAVTVGRRRALGLAEEAHGGDVRMQGLYSKSQTEVYRPPPVVDGNVPKNDFGNIDLYVDTMLPSGGVHLPYKGIAKIARELGFDYAEAVTGFEFKNRHAFPILTGVVVAAENESALLEAYWASAQDAEEKERIKREERILKRWTRLVQGLRIRKRLQEEYANKPIEPHGRDNREDVPEEGGFILETADSVVQPYSLPKPLHPLLGGSSKYSDEVGATFDADIPCPSRADEVDDDEDMEEVAVAPSPIAKTVVGTSTPKTMQQLAEANVYGTPVGAQEQTTQEVVDGSRPNRGRRNAGRRRKRDRGTDRSSETAEESSEDSRVKRSRVTATPAFIASTRVLRARIPKSEEQKRREKEWEAAYRRAIAE